MSDTSAGRAYLAAARRQLVARHERLAHCLGQLDDGQVWWRPRDGMNSIGNLVLHLCGNLRQWIVSGVGGAADVRDRTAEFAERGPVPRDELLRRLAAVVAEADAVLAGADAAALLEPRTVQGFRETVLSAVFDCLVHLGGHTQEIVCLTRLQLGDAYRFAWVPTPEQGGAAGATETVAVRDAAFADMAGHPLGPAATEPKEPPLRDYVRELGQEFQEEQDEGKLR